MNLIPFIKKKIKHLESDTDLRNKLLFLLVTISFLVRLIYVFYFTDYKNYLFSDAGAYWSRANGRYGGAIFPLWQWTAWATCFHFYLTFVFKISR